MENTGDLLNLNHNNRNTTTWKTQTILTVVAVQEGPSVLVVGDSYRTIIGSEQINGAYELIDMLIPPKGGLGPHSHVTFGESFYILASHKCLTKN